LIRRKVFGMCCHLAIDGPDATTYLLGGCHNLPISDICTTTDLDRSAERRP
jgi:hypothetical protein